MKYTVKTTAQFRRDYRRGEQHGRDMAVLDRVIDALAEGEPLPPEHPDRPLSGKWAGYRECRITPGWVLIYRMDGDILVLTLTRTGTRAELFQKGDNTTMKNWFKALYRSPVKTAVTFLLLAASAFLMIYNLADYALNRREYLRTAASYRGVLTVDTGTPAVAADKSFSQHKMFPYFLFTDETIHRNNGTLRFMAEGFHKPGMSAELTETLSGLAYVSRTSSRYMTAGVSPDRYRLDLPTADSGYTNYEYAARVVIEATIQEEWVPSTWTRGYRALDVKTMRLKDVKLLAGKQEYLDNCRDSQGDVLLWTEAADPEIINSVAAGRSVSMNTEATAFDNFVWLEDFEKLQPGRRYVFVARGNAHHFGFDWDALLFADDAIEGWWPYYTDITDLPENYLETEEFAPLRKLMQVTDDDTHTFDVVYTEDMSAIRRVQQNRLLCTEGRMIGVEDAGSPVCCVSSAYAEAYGVGLGDTVTLSLGDRLFEQYSVLGAIACSEGRYAEHFTEPLDFTVVGIWEDMDDNAFVPRELYWSYNKNTVFIPLSFLPETADTESRLFQPGEVSFLVENSADIIPFINESLPMVKELGVTFQFNDGGWSQIEPQLRTAQTLALTKLLIFSVAALLSVLLTVYLFVARRKRDYAVQRALGAPKRVAFRSLFLPLMSLGILAVLLGGGFGALKARTDAALTLETFSAMGMEADPTLPLPVLLLGLVLLLLVLTVSVGAELRYLGRIPPLTLLQGGAVRRVKPAPAVPEEEAPAEYRDLVLSDFQPVKGRALGHVCRYVFRHARRAAVRSLLAILLAALLATAIGEMTALRQHYRELYQSIEVKARFYSGLPYSKIKKLEDSGYLTAPYYESVVGGVEVELDGCEFCFASDLRTVQYPITFLEGYDAATVMDQKEKICILPRPFMEKLGLELGDRVLLSEQYVMGNFRTNYYLKTGIKEYDDTVIRPMVENARPKAVIVGVIETREPDETVYLPMCMVDAPAYSFALATGLSYAEYTLIDYHSAFAFRKFVKDFLAQLNSEPFFDMDTSEADQVYKTYRLLETLYPLTAAVALILGAVLPGLIILQCAQEAGLLRALGTTKGRTRSMLTLEQALLCLLGLLLAGAGVCTLHRPDLGVLFEPFGLYLAAHLLACILGSLAFAVKATGKNVLELLQEKE